MRTLAIIPARGGSKRVPYKNIKLFDGQPMISHVLDIAEQTAIFDEIHVSTDDPKIIDVLKDVDCIPDFIRPLHLSDDDTPIMEVIKFVVETYEQQGRKFDVVCLLYATSPLIDPMDLQKALKFFIDSDRKSALLAVTKYATPIEKAWVFGQEQTLIPKDMDAFFRRTQDLQPAYYDAGMFCFYTPNYIKKSDGAGNPKGFRGYQVPSFRVTDIDEPEDWERAELLYSLLNKQQ